MVMPTDAAPQGAVLAWTVLTLTVRAIEGALGIDRREGQ